MKRWKLGRGRASVMLIAGPDVHVFVFAKQLGSDAYGVTVRRRVGKDWRHYRVTMLQLNVSKRDRSLHSKRRGKVLRRRSLTLFEASSWHTSNGQRERVGTKGYIRVKVAWPGKEILA